MSKKQLVFSGVQPTGNLHLGNYLGAIKNWVTLQKQYESIFCIVDLHAITVPQDPKLLTEHTRETAAAYIACGIDPKKSIIFNQSSVSGHSELAWILGCLTPMGWLERMTQFKEKGNITNIITELNKHIEESIYVSNNTSRILSDLNSRDDKATKQEILQVLQAYHALATKLNDIMKDSNEIESKKEKVKLGLLSYPILMAADILLYKATHVPVGEDQKQHLELSRDIAGAFNRQYKQEYFPIPEPLIMGEATRIMSLNDGTRKMSKSEESDYSRINLTDDADAIRKKFQKAKSDSVMGFESIEGRPDATNLLTIYAALSDSTLSKAQEKFASAGFGGLKKELAELAVNKLEPISKEMNKLRNDKGYLDSILKSGAEKAREIAEKNIKDIKNIVGFINY